MQKCKSGEVEEKRLRQVLVSAFFSKNNPKLAAEGRQDPCGVWRTWLVWEALEQLQHVGSEREATLDSVMPQLLLETMVGDDSTLLWSQNKHSSAISM